MRCLRAPTESVLVERENSSRGGAYNQQHKHPLQDAETSEYQQDGVPGEYGLDTKEKDKSDATTSEEETNAHVFRKRADNRDMSRCPTVLLAHGS